MRGLFIGRFQPFHLGHINALKWILEQVDEAIVAIGSANVALTFRNPFTIGERIEMITRALRKEGLLDRVYICSVPDTDSMHTLWPHYLEHWCPKFDIVYTNDPLSQLCVEYAGIKYSPIPFFDREKYSGTRIRLLMARGDPTWRQLVPQEVAEYLDKIRAEERLRKLAMIESILTS